MKKNLGLLVGLSFAIVWIAIVTRDVTVERVNELGRDGRAITVAAYRAAEAHDPENGTASLVVDSSRTWTFDDDGRFSTVDAWFSTLRMRTTRYYGVPLKRELLLGEHLVDMLRRRVDEEVRGVKRKCDLRRLEGTAPALCDDYR